MTGPEPNAAQRELIESTEGIYLVDAGPGTGKTFAVSRRYATVVDRTGVDPEDVLVVTFTNNAATEMKERIVENCEYGMRELADAPIQTFHSLCHDLLEEHGHAAPTHLGIDDRITQSTRIVEDDLVERALFRAFVDRFQDDHPEYDDRFRALPDPTELRDLIGRLAAKGVVPAADGWYRDGEGHLDGDLAAFERRFREGNQPRNDGRTQSRLRARLGRYGTDKCYLPDAPPKAAVRGDGKQAPADLPGRVFPAERTGLKRFVRDVYHEYLAFALARNYLTFGFLQLFAFVLLRENHRLRDEVGFEYLMIDEFQDTSEIQFELALLLAGTDNVCVVGDWKQSIYSFQYADVDNIVEFESRLERFVDRSNDDHERISFDPRPVSTIELVENYRSTQAIIDFSEETLCVPATNGDQVDVDAVSERIVPLSSNADHENTTIEAIQSEAEHEAILAKILDIVGNEDYAVQDEDGHETNDGDGDSGDGGGGRDGDGDGPGEVDDGLRPPTYGDIAVVTRTRDFGRELLDAADEYGLSMAYEGGIELFRTDQAKLLLAWLRILEDDTDRGWATVLEKAGYTLDEIDHMLERGEYPMEMMTFRAELRGMETLGGVARRVFARYGYDGPTADVVLRSIQSVHDATTLTRGDLIRFIERGIETGSTHEVHAGTGTDAVTVQTIHATKGLEYPIVIIANMNRHSFPPHGASDGVITYEEPIGLRQRKVYAESAHGNGLAHVYDDWRTDVLRTCLPRKYDEERRLLYVATTRAESHVVFSAGETPNTFLEELPVEIESVAPEVPEVPPGTTEQTTLQVDIPVPEGPRGTTPHALMDDDVFEDVVGGRGKAFGNRVHDFAEEYAAGKADRVGGTGEDDEAGEAIEPQNDHEAHVRAFIDSLEGDVSTEVDAHLPLSVDGRRVMISGTIDLVHVTPERVEVIDYKTDPGRQAEAEYRKQLSIYYHVAMAEYPGRDVSAAILYTATGDRQEITPHPREDLVELVGERGLPRG